MTVAEILPADKRLCGCGCGELIPKFSKHRGEFARFKRGHNNRGENHHNWKGGRRVHSGGYILVYRPDHPRADKRNGCVFEHILVMEQKLGRPLQPDELVHHINGNKQDNRKQNLHLTTRPEHAALHHTIDMSDRVCCDCCSAITYRRKWYKACDGKWRCAKCALRYKRNRGLRC